MRVEELRRERNEIAAKMKGGKPAPELIAKGKKVKEELAKLEVDLDKVEAECTAALKSVPNIIFDDVPLGGEEDSVEIKAWGGKSKEGVDHLDYAMSRDWVELAQLKKALLALLNLKNGVAFPTILSTPATSVQCRPAIGARTATIGPLLLAVTFARTI